MIDGSTHKTTATFNSSAYGPSINVSLNQMNVGEYFHNKLHVFDPSSNIGAGPYETATDSTNGRTTPPT
ncbi:hypothetical protein [Nannocystis punicea]|uniref:Uncharacterized protein n=1 Tax=Nannocystis punicea TaxID=2995304 RepID=A0ABY7H8L2_9BACT|nr:hypothetical protein [Nannocystis poenicansa]WAS95374.1 hypothetical protein O0S08_04375 [Nannocystis poenicansa]